jgi:hypothetical protein
MSGIHVRNGPKFGIWAHMSCIELSILSIKLYKTSGIDNGFHKALASQIVKNISSSPSFLMHFPGKVMSDHTSWSKILFKII